MRSSSLLAALAGLVLCNSAAAETLPEALTDALRTSPQLASERAQLNAVRQELPLAWSEALPQITTSASALHQQQSEPTFVATVRQEPQYWVGTVNSSILLFGSGRVWSSTREARARIASAVASYDDAAQQLMLQVVNAYGGVLLARSVKEAQDRALSNLQEQLRYVQANVDHGFLTHTDLAQARARVEQARAGVASANVDLVQADETYLRLIGHSPGELDPAPSLDGLPANLDAALEIAGRENPRIVSATANVQQARAAIGVAASAGRARVTLEASDSIFGAIDPRPNSRQQSEDVISLRATLPLFSGGSVWARTRQEHYRHSAAEMDLANTQRQVHEDVSVAWANVYATRATVSSSHARLEAAELAQRGMVREQQAGLRTTIDVLNQEQELLSARVDLARAQRDALVADRQLAATIGRLAALSLEDKAPAEAHGDRNYERNQRDAERRAKARRARQARRAAAAQRHHAPSRSQ